MGAAPRLQMFWPDPPLEPPPAIVLPPASPTASGADYFKQLRAGRAAPPQSEPWTVDACYRRLIKPMKVADKIDADTIDQDERAVRRWSGSWKWLGQAPDGVSGTLLEGADDDELDTLIEAIEDVWLRHEARGFAEPTAAEITWNDLFVVRHYMLCVEEHGPRLINKHIATIQAAIRAGSEKGWWPAGPKLKRLAENTAAAKHYLTAEQVSAVYDQCPHATWPIGLPAPTPWYWELLLALFWNLGSRTSELVGTESDDRPMTWDCVHWDPQTPHPLGHGVNELGWIMYTPPKTETKKPEPLCWPINATMQSHLKRIAPKNPQPGDLIFPFPLNADYFYDQWYQLFDLAGVKTKIGTHVLMKYMRKTSNIWHNKHCPGSGMFVLGHAARGEEKVNKNHYDVAEQTLLTCMPTFPQPAAFARPSSAAGPHQRRLF